MTAVCKTGIAEIVHNIIDKLGDDNTTGILGITITNVMTHPTDYEQLIVKTIEVELLQKVDGTWVIEEESEVING